MYFNLVDNISFSFHIKTRSESAIGHPRLDSIQARANHRQRVDPTKRPLQGPIRTVQSAPIRRLLHNHQRPNREHASRA